MRSHLRGAGTYVKTLYKIAKECIDSVAEARYLAQLKKMKNEESRMDIRVSNLEESTNQVKEDLNMLERSSKWYFFECVFGEFFRLGLQDFKCL